MSVHADELACTCGEPRTPYVWKSNPAFDQWAERHAIETCVTAHNASMLPCWDHLRAARRVGLAIARGQAVGAP